MFSHLSRQFIAPLALFLTMRAAMLAIFQFWRIYFNISIICLTPPSRSVYSSYMAIRRLRSGFVRSSNAESRLSGLTTDCSGHCQCQVRWLLNGWLDNCHVMTIVNPSTPFPSPAIFIAHSASTLPPPHELPLHDIPSSFRWSRLRPIHVIRCHELLDEEKNQQIQV